MAESVRVVCRFRPVREQLLRGGGQGGSTVPSTGRPPTAGKANGAASSASSPAPALPADAIQNASGSHNPATGFQISYALDGKSLTFTPSGAPGVKPKEYPFTFDTVFPPDTTQEDAFNGVAKETVADVLKGYNGTIFAFGQTGSGKTHTMFGKKDDEERKGGRGGSLRGVIPRAADELFAGIADSDELDEVTIRCSFMEVYMENIRDLLQPKATGLKIREMPTGEVYVQGLSDEYVSSSADIMALLAAGEKNRSTSSTGMNEVSSRSHSVLIVVVNQKLKDGSVRVGKLNLADLAGSERIERTGAKGTTLEEAKKINQSLSALANCIAAITDSKRSHIPFRDSTLTFLLKDSLGGNTKTTLLVCCSPEESDHINMKLGVAELTVMVAELKKELQIAHKTIAVLQKTIRTMQAGGSIPPEMLGTLLKPFTSSASVAAIEQLPSGMPLSEVPVTPMLHNALDHAMEMQRRASQDYSPGTSPDSGLLSPAELAATDAQLADESLSPLLQTEALSPERDLPPLSELPELPSDDSAASPSPQPTPAIDSVPAALLQERDAKLVSALHEIEVLRSALEASNRAQEEREHAWMEERAQLEAAAAAAATPAPAPQLSGSNADQIAALLAKNQRLEKQMAEMKETWTAYLDLILENQKAQDKERRGTVLDEDGASDSGAGGSASKGAKIVVPVRKAGFFSTLFKKNATLPAPSTASASAAASPDGSPTRPAHSRASSIAINSPDLTSRTRELSYASPAPPSGVSSPITPALSRTISTPQQRSTVASPANLKSDALFVGYLAKKPVGFSLTRQWRRRLFVLRADSVDYYELEIPSSIAANSPKAPSASAASAAGGALVAFPPTPSLQYLPPAAALREHLRGSIALDASTSVVAVQYADVSHAFELTTRDKHTKLHAPTEAERTEWIRLLQGVVQCKKHGRDPASLFTQQHSHHHHPGQLDPDILLNANVFLKTHMDNLPEPSPTPLHESHDHESHSTAQTASALAAAASYPAATQRPLGPPLMPFSSANQLQQLQQSPDSDDEPDEADMVGPGTAIERSAFLDDESAKYPRGQLS